MSASNKAYVSTLLMLVVCLLLFSFSPQRKALEDKKKNLQDELKSIEQLQKETKEDQEKSVNELGLLKVKITKQQDAIDQYHLQIQQLKENILQAEQEIQTISNRVGNLQNDYANTIRNTYMSQNSYSKLAFLFSSEDFNDAYRRYKYVKSYSDHRRKQFDELLTIQDTLYQNIQRLEHNKEEKITLLTQQEQIKQQLVADKKNKEQLIIALGKQSKELKQNWEITKEAETNLQNQIAMHIEQEIAAKKAEQERLAKKAAQERRDRLAAQEKQNRLAQLEQAKKERTRIASQKTASNAAKKQAIAGAKIGKAKAVIATTQKKATQTVAARPLQGQENVVADKSPNKEKNNTLKTLAAPRDLAPSGKSFKAKKGSLPWPVRSGQITGKFGTHPHPVLKNITITNNGIDINTNKGATVYTVFEGVVTKKIYTPTFQWAVIVKHGNHFTVYTNLKTTKVNEGDRVSSQQAIGTAYTNTNKGGTVVHLEVWEGKKKVNPIKWLRKSV